MAIGPGQRSARPTRGRSRALGCTSSRTRGTFSRSIPRRSSCEPLTVRRESFGWKENLHVDDLWRGERGGAHHRVGVARRSEIAAYGAAFRCIRPRVWPTASVVQVTGPRARARSSGVRAAYTAVYQSWYADTRHAQPALGRRERDSSRLATAVSGASAAKRPPTLHCGFARP